MSSSPTENRVLVVEDAPANIQALTAILREKGYAISIATHGRQALAVLASVRPDLILLDVMMPEMDGFETCSRIKARPEWRDIPIIFLTAKSDPADIVRGFELGAVDYVAKPFHAHELLARVNTHLTMHRLRQENEQLVRAEAENARHRSVAQMVAGVAHEINTPLGIINTAASLLNKWLSEPVMQELSKTAEGQMMAEDLGEAAGLITRNAHRAHKLVQDFKKVSVNQITDVREKTSLSETIEETVSLFRATARQSPLEVLFTNALPDPRGEWIGYPGSMSQVLLNLLSNAQRYAYPEGIGGKVEIVLAASPQSPSAGYTITVRDFGEGISSENLTRIFEPFFTTGRGKGGSGLGMSIVHAIVTDHMKGAITVESTVGAGTKVMIDLPLAVPE